MSDYRRDMRQTASQRKKSKTKGLMASLNKDFVGHRPAAQSWFKKGHNKLRKIWTLQEESGKRKGQSKQKSLVISSDFM